MLLESTPAALDEVRQILDDIRKDDQRASEVIRPLRALLRKRADAHRSQIIFRGNFEPRLQPRDLLRIRLQLRPRRRRTCAS